ncbi:MAG: TSUP family transporter [Streptosporangiales bacterium]|nr:TSUP family transporter [Streptosporangiales bacterium]
MSQEVVTTGVWVAGAVIALAAGYVQGLTGLGFAIVFTPLYVLFVPRPHEVVLLSLLLGTVLSLGVLADSRRAFRVRRSVPLLVGAAVGTPAGVAVLSFVPNDALTILIAVTALVAAALWIVRLPPPTSHETAAVGLAGLLGGFLNGSTSMGGPPPALVASMQRWPVQESRAALTTFNLASYVIAVAVGLTAGLADGGFLLRGLLLLPVAIGGSILGAWSARRVSRQAFGRVLAGVVCVAGVLALVSTFT